MPKKQHAHSKHAASHAPKHDERSGIADADITAGLSAIYGETRDDLKVMARGGSAMTRFLVRAIIALSVVCVSVAIGYLVYQRFFTNDDDSAPLTMTFVVPSELTSGAPVHLELLYANNTGYPLTNVEIDVNVPQGFLMTSSAPLATNATDFTWVLGTISAHSDGKIVVDGLWQADVPSTTGIQALASYKPANFNAQFNDIVTATVTTNASTLALTVDPVPQASAGQEISYLVRLKNSGADVIIAPTVDVTLPEGFFVKTSTPALVPGAASIFALPDLLAGTETSVTIVGTYASDVSGVRTMTSRVRVGAVRPSVQATATTETTVQGSALSLVMVGNGNEGTIAADPGSLLRVALRLENTGDVPITDASALLDFTAEDNLPITWSTAVLDGGKITAKGITFDTKRIGTLAPGAHVALNLAFPLKTDLSAVSSAFSIAFSATQLGVTVYAPSLTVVLNSEVQLTSTLRYFAEDGSPLGSGPLPPVVGSATHYRAIWSIASGVHAVKDVTVSATLPDGVVWDNFATADGGSVTYDDVTRVVRWTMSSIPKDASALTAKFSVSITPNANDEGLVKTIVGSSVFRAKDEETGAVIERTVPPVTTECIGDTRAVGKGNVQAAS